MTVILGAGISGLSAAYYALEHARIAPIVLEASNRVGGWVRTKVTDDDTVFEQGPRTVRLSGDGGKNTMNLLEELNLTKKIVPIKFNNAVVQNRLIYANDKIHRLPSTPIGWFKKNSLINRTLISAMFNDINAPAVIQDDVSLYTFVERRLGKDIADYIISPIICGICAGDARNISVRFLMEKVFELEQRYGTIMHGMFGKMLDKIKKKPEVVDENKESVEIKPGGLVLKATREGWMLWTLDGGMEQLPLVLAENVRKRGTQIKMGYKCEQLRFNPDHVEVIGNGEVTKCSHVISSLPAKSLASLVEEQHPELSRELNAIPTVTVAVVNLEFPKESLFLNAFGVLVPPKEGIPILGVSYDSCISPQKSAVLTVMMGGAWYETYFGNNPTKEHLLNVAIRHAHNILSFDADPISYNVSILKDCIPQHIVGHKKRVERICNYISEHRIPLGLCGSSYQGVGVNDVILSAKQAVSNTFKSKAQKI